MKFTIDTLWLSSFLLAMTRATAFLFITPPFSSQGVPVKVRLGLGVGLALFVAPHFRPAAGLMDSGAFIGAVVYQAFIGFAMGFCVMLLLNAFQAAGALVDFSVGFSAATAYDPFSNAGSSPLGRFYQMLAIIILFVSGGHLLIIRGFLMTFDTANNANVSGENVAEVIMRNSTTFFAAAIQIAVPLLAALFITEVALGLVSRASPQINILPLTFAVKILVLFALLGVAIKILPISLFHLVEQAADTIVILGGT